MTNFLNRLKWTRKGHIDCKVEYNNSTYMFKAILFERPGFLWIKKKKVEKIGNGAYIGRYRSIFVYNSKEYREFKLKINDWLLGGNITETNIR